MKVDHIHSAELLMDAFAERTGVLTRSTHGARYLWTDAFAVCNYLSLYQVSNDKEHLNRALTLVNMVHHSLGRHRDDDPRTGWISGLNEIEGESHPTRGGLRIGKPLNERGVHEPFDEPLEWDRDGQYFHYLTKWMLALNRVSLITGDPIFNDWAIELAQAAHHSFVYNSPGGVKRMRWKMSIDLSHPLVPSMGQLDSLDGFIVYTQLNAFKAKCEPTHGSVLSIAISDMLEICEEAIWKSDDELGIGSLLIDAAQLVQMITQGDMEHLSILDRVLTDADQSLCRLRSHNHLCSQAQSRLAFRELGLSIGLRAFVTMRDCIEHYPDRFVNSKSLLRRIDSILRSSLMIELIEGFWLTHAKQGTSAWTSNLDINAVMLATSLLPDVYLLSNHGGNIGERLSTDW